MAQYALPVLHDASEVKTSWVQLAGDGDGYASDELDEGFGAGRGSGSGPDGATTAWQTDSTSNVTRTYECALASVGDPLDSAGHIIRASVAKSATGGATTTYTLSLYQGATLIASGTPTVNNTTAYATITYTLSAAQADAITDYAALRLRLTVVISTGTARRGRVSALELETPDAGQIRYYILPIVRDATLTQRGPKYFQWGRGPDKIGTIDCQWSLKDYGSIDQAVACAYLSAAQHATVSANSDVLSLPVNIDTTMTAGAVSAAQTFLETYNIPAGWINTGDTYRATLRTITAFFLYLQRVNGIAGNFTLPSNWANLTMSQVPTDIRDAMAEAATSFGYDYSAVTGTTTVRTVLKAMADDWGTQPILFGFATL